MFNSTLDRLHATTWEVIRFATVGGICLVTGLLIQWCLFSVFQFHYLVGYAVAVVITSIVNWAMNRKWTFHSRDPRYFLEIARHQGITLSTLVLSTALFIIFVSGFGVHYLVAHVLIAILMLGINFSLQRWLVYRKR